MSHDPHPSPWAPRPSADPDAERTIAFEVPDPVPESERTIAFAVPDTAPGGERTVAFEAPHTSTTAERSVAPDAPHPADWALQRARLNNRPSTDVGLLLLRVLSLPLVLHGAANAVNFFVLVDTVRDSPGGAGAPELIAGLVVAGQLGLPVLLAVGFGTRWLAAAQVVVMGGLYALGVLAGTPVLDPAAGSLTGEGVLAYAALALPLVFTGPGRFSLDHAITASSRQRLVERRVERAVARRAAR